MICRGRRSGELVEISQWCNDWFSTTEPRVYNPTQLAFTSMDMRTIATHKNNGTLFSEYETKTSNPKCGIYVYTFKKIQFKKSRVMHI